MRTTCSGHLRIRLYNRHMSSFETQPQDPNIVFTDEYWGDVHGETEPLKASGATHDQKVAAKRLLGVLTPAIINGSVAGTLLEQGNFNPQDEELAQSFAHNMAGVVLLADVEGLRPHSSFTKSERRTSNGSPKDQSAGTRTLLSSGVSFEETIITGSIRTVYQPGRVIYSDMD